MITKTQRIAKADKITAQLKKLYVSLKTAKKDSSQESRIYTKITDLGRERKFLDQGSHYYS